ncbi:MAG: cytochrome C [Acidiphilium sp.]|nr:cytochrome C [Acidiphilium sp.]MDD4936236.1 cytochrome C [Acidiphilium sp.]
MIRPVAILTPLTALLLCLTAAQAAPAPTSAMSAQVGSMRQAIAQGKKIYVGDSFGSTRTWVPDMAFHSRSVTCDTCHTNGGKTQGTMPDGRHIASLVGSATDFPRYNPKKHEVFTLQRQLVHCIRAGIGGTAPAYNSPVMVDLEVYLIALSKNTPMGRNVK